VVPRLRADAAIAITGCTTGIGLIVAKVAVTKKASHVLLLNRTSARADAAEREIKQLLSAGRHSTVVETVPCDLQDFQSVKEAAALIKSKCEAVDVLCNNAGTCYSGLLCSQWVRSKS
jgi:short-subunit dehydrogenase